MNSVVACRPFYVTIAKVYDDYVVATLSLEEIEMASVVFWAPWATLWEPSAQELSII